MILIGAHKNEKNLYILLFFLSRKFLSDAETHLKLLYWEFRVSIKFPALSQATDLRPLEIDAGSFCKVVCSVATGYTMHLPL